MFPDFLDLFGIDLQGRLFERLFWFLSMLVASWGIYGGVLLLKEKEPLRAGVRIALSVALFVWAGGHAITAWFVPDAPLFFEEELVVRTYALMTVAGFGLGAWLATREGRRVGISTWAILDIAFGCLIAGLIGARLTFIAVTFDEQIAACVNPAALSLAAADCSRIFRFWEGGMVFYGGFIGAAFALFWYAHRYRLNPWLVADTAIPSLAIGHFLGRIGCLGAGCCWGEVCGGEWGIQFGPKSLPFLDQVRRLQAGDPTISPLGFGENLSLHVHPTQLYEGFGELIIFLILIYFRGRKKMHGEVLALWLLLYGGFRTLSEVTRGDALRGHVSEWPIPALNEALNLPTQHVTFLSTSQLIGLLMATLGAALWVYLQKKFKTFSQTPS